MIVFGVRDLAVPSESTTNETIALCGSRSSRRCLPTAGERSGIDLDHLDVAAAQGQERNHVMRGELLLDVAQDDGSGADGCIDTEELED